MMMTRRHGFLVGLILVAGLGLLWPAPAATSLQVPGGVARPWVPSAHNPILRADSACDRGGLNEPSVVHDAAGGGLALFYAGSPDGVERHTAVCLATLPAGADPLRAGTWTKRGVVVAAPALEPFVLPLPGGRLRLFASAHADLLVRDSSDGGRTWHPRGVALRSGEAGVSWWAKAMVWQDARGLWQCLCEGGGQAGPWHIYHATARDGVHFRLDGRGPLLSLAVGRGGMEGGPEMPVTRPVAGRYQLWYHASSDGGWSTIDVYHATSTDLRTWTPDPGPVAAHGSAFAIADNPALVTLRGHRYLFWGTCPRGGINVARLGAAAGG